MERSTNTSSRHADGDEGHAFKNFKETVKNLLKVPKTEADEIAQERERRKEDSRSKEQN